MRNCPDCMTDENAVGEGVRCAAHEIVYLRAELAREREKVADLSAIINGINTKLVPSLRAKLAEARKILTDWQRYKEDGAFMMKNLEWERAFTSLRNHTHDFLSALSRLAPSQSAEKPCQCPASMPDGEHQLPCGCWHKCDGSCRPEAEPAPHCEKKP